ncbi:TRAP-T family transporter [Alloalcanivorax dieselolei B5]|uniref:TRAP-T family transporter n=1 Tax=Alcanivorax dieselolei (strain DSM 16502 / CGMCC 1.3690 / MCCC 1A00001 / B-5) TaxID=930169 RepID=K0CHQ9_ALCDB|nr:TAXI family TRAP transporter solute-binding subunit [Alloalcanivorax dieselolei]AFT71131.1 TRAP-T family transporter [Alloalcanivorax dieselolei B5]GGJ93311.1 TRAP ABC transporter [Alloalcanivorax dieselolei]
MKTKLKSLIAGGMLALATAFGGQSAYAQNAVNLKMASFNVGGSWYIYATALSKLAQEALPEGSKVEVLPYQGGVGNPILVNRGEADMGLSFSALSNWAYNGKITFSEENQNIRALFGGLNQPHRLGIVVRKDSGIASLADLSKEKARLVTVQRGGAGEALAHMALEAYGTSYSDLEKAGGRVTHVDLPVAIQQMRDGQADIFIHNIGYKQPDVMELALSGKVKFIPLGEKQMNVLENDYGLLGDLSIKPEEFDGVDTAVPSVGYPTGVIANADMPDNVAYAITKAVIEHPDRIRAAHASLSAFDPAKAGKAAVNGNIPLHPGAARYYREAGLIE